VPLLSRYLALLSGEAEEAFSPEVLARFPRAIFADLRALRTTTWVQWWLRDHGRFRNEMLRIVSSILEVKAGTSVTYEELRRRDRARSIQRSVMPACLMTLVLLTLAAYYVATPQFAWYYTQLGQANVSSIWHVAKPDGTASIFAVSERAEPWIDQAGHQGKDTAVTITEITEDGRSIGAYMFSVTDTGEFFWSDSASGSLRSLGEEELGALKRRLGYVDAYKLSDARKGPSKVRYELPLSIGGRNHFPPVEHQYDDRRAFQIRGVSDGPPFPIFQTEDGGLTWMKTGEVTISTRDAVVWDTEGAEGVTFVGAAEVFDPYDPFAGGLYRTIDFGKTWLEMNPIRNVASWSTLAAVGANRTDPNEIVAALRSAGSKHVFGKVVAEASPGGVWITRDNGTHWQALGLTNRVVAEMIVTSTDGIIARILNGDGQGGGHVLVHKRRAALDRLLGRYDLR
jgi:hypothetical protein